MLLCCNMVEDLGFGKKPSALRVKYVALGPFHTSKHRERYLIGLNKDFRVLSNISRVNGTL